MTIIQTLKDGVDKVDGLDNPRLVKLAKDKKTAYVLSGDDNSLSVFDINHKNELSQSDMINSDEQADVYLEGAAGLVVLDDSKRLAVVSFYNGALSLFGQSETQSYTPLQVISDHLAPERVFKSAESLADKDNFGLLGAWDIAKSNNGKQLFVAGYKSNEVAVFNLTSEGLEFAYKVHRLAQQPKSLGSPVSIALSNTDDRVFILGYEGNTLTIYSKDEDSKLSFKQQLENPHTQPTHFNNPQKILLSADSKTVYVANSTGSSISVFSLQDDEYSFTQSVVHDGLKGVGSLLLSHDGKKLYAAGEQDSGFVQFAVAPNGTLNFANRYNSPDQTIHSVSSMVELVNDKLLLVLSAKADALYVVELPE
ncbi:beta-propeller fold lactonase family protein [Pseudoalteromonas byunsanensis]|uniref:beta-propeller fold lactonase family protein n=1 Tax=Pseudoalteromonas byunsanensis TaxID=327939 RepID=UPI001586743F|nr:beta-propeller fold lactonase family protein [Pseudoalteromonas byunsanensis]